jgi:4-carboxymuconolactone decarboxylase
MGQPSAGAEPAGRADRLPPVPEEHLTPEQREALREITAGPRGEASGPFVPLLRSPELMTRLQRTGEYLRFHSALEPRLVEMAILLVARHWDQAFEWTFHHPLALAAGLDAQIVDAIAHGLRPQRMDPAATAVWDLVDELHRTHDVSDTAYTAAVAALGEVGVVDLVGTVGYYTTLAMVMNTAHTPAPTEPALPERRRG